MIYRYPNYTGEDFPDLKLRQKLIRTYKKLISLGLNRGTSGNCSVRCDRGNQFLITPSGVSLEKMTPASIVQMELDGSVHGNGKPSSEWRFHCDILKQRPDAQALVHTHSVTATALACLRKEIPAFHYMVAIAGGDSIRCAPYALFGTQALSDGVLDALEGRKACLMANHGVIALGRDLHEAVQIAQEVENLAEQYLKACSIGEPHLLSKSEMGEVLEKFKNYGYKLGNQPS
jgi:L-fuculose-phosphate aldolase